MIATETLQKADQVDCAPDEYRSGLRSIIAVLENAVAASEEMDN